MTEVRFGQWDAILAQAEPPAPLPYPDRHLALRARHGRYPQGRSGRGATRTRRTPRESRRTRRWPRWCFFEINRADRLLDVAVALLRGELLRADGRQADGITALHEAVVAEDALNYAEPAGLAAAGAAIPWARRCWMPVEPSGSPRGLSGGTAEVSRQRLVAIWIGAAQRNWADPGASDSARRFTAGVAVGGH